MVNKDILGGLRSALTRGYTLEEAMLSFFNAGYKRNEIEEAAKALQSAIDVQPSLELQPKPIWEPPKKKVQAPIPPFKPELKTRIPVSPVQVQPKIVSKPVIQKPVEVAAERVPIAAPVKQKVISRVFEYTGENLRIRTITTLLVILLAILIGILGLMYIFRAQIISFFNSIFT